MKTTIITITAIFSVAILFLVAGCTKQKSAATTQVVFFVKQDCGVGTITVTVNGSTQTITKFFATGTPACGAAGAATFTLPAAGTYLLSAKGGTTTWNDSFTVTAGTCNAFSLNCSGSTGGTGYYYANWTCNGSAQCASIMGAAQGSNGPFCTLTDCQAWGNKFIPGGYTCATSANTSPILGGTPPNGVCFKIGDF